VTEARDGEAAVTAALDELYAAPFDRFIPLRRELALRLRGAGNVAGARRVSEAKKPTRTAWALNQVARKNSELVAAVIETRRAAAGAPKAGDAGAIRAVMQRYREAIARAVGAVRSTLAADGVGLSPAQSRRVGETLQAIATDPTEREKLSTGRLTADIEVEDPFAGIEVGPVRSHVRSPHDGPAKPAPARDTTAARAQDAERHEQARVAEAKRRAHEEALASLRALEQKVAAARKTALEADRNVRFAQHAADQAREALASLERQLDRSRVSVKQ
jgi:hypothetical protein